MVRKLVNRAMRKGRRGLARNPVLRSMELSYAKRSRIPLKYNPKKVGAPNTARVVQTLPTIDLAANTPYRISVAGITGDRARAHAEQYGLYRIAKIEFKYKPYYDTFIPQNQGPTPSGNFPTTVPLLYWKMNRYADAPVAWTVDDIKDLGAKPHRLDDKTYTLSYKPNILLANESAGSVSGTVKMTPWLNTDDSADTAQFAPSTTEHLGHFFWIDCNLVNGQNEPNIASLDVTIHYEFKTPRTEWTPSSMGGKLTIDPLRITHSQTTEGAQGVAL